MEIEIPKCEVCGTEFDNIFDATDHLTDDNDEEEFNPKFVLPNGYVLLLGGLLRQLYDKADQPDEIRTITQLTFGTLYAANTDVTKMKQLVEDAVIYSHMSEIDEELKELLEEEE